MNENTNICETIKNKISGAGELSEAETLHAEGCPDCMALIEESMNPVSAAAHRKIRSLQKIAAEPEFVIKPSRRFSPYKFAAVLTLLLIAVLLIPHKNIISQDPINNDQAYPTSKIEINFPELAGTSLSEDIDSYFEKQSELINKIYGAQTTRALLSGYDNYSSDINLESIAKTFKLPENGEDHYSSLFSISGGGAFENISMDESIY